MFLAYPSSLSDEEIFPHQRFQLIRERHGGSGRALEPRTVTPVTLVVAESFQSSLSHRPAAGVVICHKLKIFYYVFSISAGSSLTNAFRYDLYKSFDLFEGSGSVKMISTTPKNVIKSFFINFIQFHLNPLERFLSYCVHSSFSAAAS